MSDYTKLPNWLHLWKKDATPGEKRRAVLAMSVLAFLALTSIVLPRSIWGTMTTYIVGIGWTVIFVGILMYTIKGQRRESPEEDRQSAKHSNLPPAPLSANDVEKNQIGPARSWFPALQNICTIAAGSAVGYFLGGQFERTDGGFLGFIAANFLAFAFVVADPRNRLNRVLRYAPAKSVGGPFLIGAVVAMLLSGLPISKDVFVGGSLLSLEAACIIWWTRISAVE